MVRDVGRKKKSSSKSSLWSLQNFAEKEEMGFKSMKIRQTLSHAVSLGVSVATALMIWKALMCMTGCESPVVVVLTGSMEPGFSRGDLLFLHMSKDPIRAGEILVFIVKDREIPIVHRVIRVHEERDTDESYFLTKGDSNHLDDRALYAHGQDWLEPQHIMGRAVGYLPYFGYVTIIMTEKPIIKYILFGTLGLLLISPRN
ncbi:hypothetical protein FEM48_Zijuj01G0197800 [Ziziphus jujuba var. spinosa]|uniref:Signal peptidase complex catalytic subunit SEC11 n=1 Tax=Ziziphus jujuba var. spinosa TaxID=714518 RepID=A0A978W374_ZIZJJ|nr:hypothetical protein FEM48_Zijuj01G0197800 [Ziziphus jujuba var. spinosa]